ncbi:MAG: HAD family hydrolase [Myxococcota bacterium]|nr:HAD family hydrolase [Myxococcota bacterium]
MEELNQQPLDWDSVEVVSWDLDGTLYALEPMVQAFKRNVLSDLLKGKIWGTATGIYTLWRRLTTMRAVRARGGIDGLPTPSDDTHVKLRMARWHSEAVGDVGAQPGLADLLKAIDIAGRRQIVITDYEAEGKLDALKLPIPFERVFEGEVLGAIKPSPRLFETILEELALSPHALLHIGDRDESDGVAARAAGCQVLILGKDFESYSDLRQQLLGH